MALSSGISSLCSVGFSFWTFFPYGIGVRERLDLLPMRSGAPPSYSPLGGPGYARPPERSEKMTNLQIANRDFGPIEDSLGTFASVDARSLMPLFASQDALAVLSREQEQAAIEAQDVLSQADEALVMG
jgi:hypothetical protein